jgi:hypothetical protein
MLRNGSKSDLNGIFNAVAESKMSGQPDLDVPEVEQGRAKILFHLILLLAFALYRADQGAPVNDRYIKALHAAKIR